MMHGTQSSFHDFGTQRRMQPMSAIPVVMTLTINFRLGLHYQGFSRIRQVAEHVNSLLCIVFHVLISSIL